MSKLRVKCGPHDFCYGFYLLNFVIGQQIEISKFKLQAINKNPAYGRQSISSSDTKKTLIGRKNWLKKKLFFGDNFTPLMSKSIQI